jgi:predicted permease
VTPLLGTRDLIDLGAAVRGIARVEGDYLDRAQKLLPNDEKVSISFVSPGFFTLLGVRSATGRLFASDENTFSAGAPVAVISESFRRRHFSSGAAALGQELRVDDKRYTVVGVMSESFSGLELTTVDMWVPLRNMPGGANGPPLLRLLARLDKDIEMTELDGRLTRQFRETHLADPMVEAKSAIISAPLLPALGPANALFRIPGMSDRNITLATRLGLVGCLVLLIALANVASLLLMRTLRRRREIAVRMAIGASRLRLFAQLTTESAVLALLAAAVALLFATMTAGLLRRELSTFTWAGSIIDSRVVVFTLGSAVLGGALAGFLATALALRTDVASPLRAGTSGQSRRASVVRSGLLIVQSALCMALLAGSAVFVQSLRRAGEIDRGFDAAHSIEVRVPGFYPSSMVDMTAIADRLRMLPGVEQVGSAFSGLSMKGLPTKVGMSRTAIIESGPRGPLVEFVEPAFLMAASARVAEGRLLSQNDSEERVAVINRSLARALWSNQAATGSCIYIQEPVSTCRRVVGVINDFQWDITEVPAFRVYLPATQAWSKPNSAFVPNFLLVKTRAGTTPSDVVVVREAISSVAPKIPDIAVQRVSNLLESQLRPWRLAATLFGIFGTLGLAAAAIGMYGVISYDVTQRSREFGIRIAVGATSSSVVRLVLASAFKVVLTGLVLGTALALATGRLVASLLFATSPSDPFALLFTGGILFITAAAASVLPAWRATRVPPSVALSAE